MQVLKFGGSSVANAENINKVVAIVKKSLENDKTIVVVSAIGGCTDTLVKIGRLAEISDTLYEQHINDLQQRHLEIIEQLLPADFRNSIQHKVTTLFDELRGICKGVFLIKELSSSTMDLILSFGELLSSTIIAERLSSVGLPCRWYNALELVKTAYHHGQNTILYDITYQNIHKLTSNNNGKLYVIPGFIASDMSGHVTTLGRGGSDYTASLVAVGARARRLEIWTDVDGMMTADPRISSGAMTIEHISYREALELSHFGAKVIYPLTIQPVVEHNIPILIKNTFSPEKTGTLIEKNPPEGRNAIKGISGSNHIAILSMEGSGMIGIPGYSSRLFDVLSKNAINIILITQASSVHTMLIAIDEQDADKAKKTVDEFFAFEISQHKIEPLKVEKGFSIISVVGDDMKSQAGVSAHMFEAISSKGINIRAIAHGSSEKNVSVVVSTHDFNEAVRAIHDEFFGRMKKQINLFIAGYGTVGKCLVEMIENQRDSLFERTGIELNIIGLCNSRKMLFDPSGLHLEAIQQLQSKGISRSYAMDFADKMIQMSYKNSLFVDCTSSVEISALYMQILSQKIGIVTCNKIANSLDMEYYRNIRQTAKSNDVPYLYETNAGAALPVICTLRQLLYSGDEIHKIEATLSGSLNYIFNHYDGSDLFASIVKQAQTKGYTEPDPRTDLKGIDLVRKALILGREIGLELEINEVQTAAFLPEECLQGSVEDFYISVEKHEAYFKGLFDKVHKAGKKLAYYIDIAKGNIQTSVGAFDLSHPFSTSKDADNVIIIYSRFYPNGIRIQGAGAGASQTASELLNNIIQSNN
ncbi:bifunctional aspartate kinase/homoserine dehydrogenase I [Bacteroidia bacterium]|nr:bifunctional aspartate kinase/homoserine dehydrogenase I [Bacteroidia bacterium]